MDKKRRCIGCNKIFNAGEMIKITKNFQNNEIIVEPNPKQQGRSAYLCKNLDCLNLAFKKDKLAKNLKTNLSNEEKENIKTVLNDIIVVQH